MIDLEFVERLIRALDDSSLDNLEVERGGTRIHLSKSPTCTHSVATVQGPLPGSFSVPSGGGVPGPVAPVERSGPPEGSSAGIRNEEESHEGLLEVKSPMVGTYYSAPAPDAPPYVEVGQRIGHGTVLCIIEAMKLMNELESEVEGTVAKVMVENAQPVEYGQVLFLIDPS